MKNHIAVVREPYKVCIEERELREMGVDEAIVEVKSSSICGSDLHIFKGKHPAVKLPVTIGHEFSGVIVKTGKNSCGFKAGDRVVLEPIINCGKCAACKSGNYGLCENASFSYRVGDGAMADYVVCKTAHLFKLDDSMSFDVGALIEPLSVARDGAELAHAFAASIEHGSLQDVFDVESRRQVAVLVGHLAVLAACKHQATNQE